MQVEKTAILKWVLVLTFSHVSCSTILHLDDLNDQVVPNLKDAKSHDEKTLQNVFSDTVKRYDNANDADDRKNVVKDFRYKRLVKRIVPHGYELKDFDYDEKFKTVFKPLVRIHRNQPDLIDSSEDEDRYDLIYILDDERIEDKARDHSLLEPFSMDNVDIKYLSNDNNVEYFIDKRDKQLNDNSQPKNQLSEFGENSYKLVNNVDKIKAEGIPRNDLDLYANNNKLKGALGTKTGHWIPNEEDPTRSKNLHNLLNKIAKFRFNKNKHFSEPKTKSEKSQRFAAMGQLLSKQFKTELENNGNKGSFVRSFTVKALPYNDAYEEKYKDMLDKIHKSVEKEIKIKDNKKEVKPLQWFGPVGLINSKQFLLSDIDDKIGKPKTYDYRNDYKYYPLENHKNWLGSLKQYIQQQKQTSNGKRVLQIDTETMDKNLKGLFETVGHINSKHITHDMLKRETNAEGIPIYFIKVRNHRQNDKEYNSDTEPFDKFTIMNEIDRLDAVNLEKELKKLMTEKKRIAAEELRTHITSSEDDTQLLQHIAQFDYVDGLTTENAVTRKPLYPFWNEWTYENVIPQDNCKGKLVQLGPLCVGAWA